MDVPALAAGLAAGAALGFALARAGLAKRERDAAAALAAAEERVRSREREAAHAARERAEAERQASAVRGEKEVAVARVAALDAQVVLEREQAARDLATVTEAREALADQFRSLAAEILEDKSRRFTEQNERNLGHLLAPLRERIEAFQRKVEDVHLKETEGRSALSEQVRQLLEMNQTLHRDARGLTEALKGSTKTQGTWGEVVLERVLEMSGLRRGFEYEVQETLFHEDGTRARPDVVVRLPENRSLVVDAKVSLKAYEEYAAATDDAARAAALKRHVESVRGHLGRLAEREYQNVEGIGTLDFVLMFLPVEPAFLLAVSHDRDLLKEAWDRNVLFVSPSTLLFVLRTVAHLWSQESRSRNAEEIARAGAKLYDKLAAFVADLDGVGDRLRQAQEGWDEARKKLATGKGNALRLAESLREMGVKPTKQMPLAMDEGGFEAPMTAPRPAPPGPAAAPLPADDENDGGPLFRDPS